MSQPAYSRVLLKLSGEVLSGDQSYGIDPSKASELANEIKNVHEMGIGIALVIGAGNIFRGIKAASKGMERVTGDYLGMLATIMNAISIQDALEKLYVQTRTLSAITVSQISEPYIRRRALRHLEKGRVLSKSQKQKKSNRSRNSLQGPLRTDSSTWTHGLQR